MSGRGRFGIYLRACRLGFRWMPAVQAWVRISPQPGGLWFVELARTAPAMTSHSVPIHVCWWEGDPEGTALFAASPWLQQQVGDGASWDYRDAVLGDDGRAAG